MKTTIDWVTFRTKTNPFAILPLMVPAFGTCGDLLTLLPGAKGHDGWERSQEIMLVDIRLGTIDYGGESQRGWVRVTLSGSGCEWVQNWEEFQKLGLVLDDYEVRRVDIALTTFKGEISDSMVVAAHESCEFSSGGRPPAMRSIVSSDPRAGKTRYIGSRAKSDKFLRCYEKGYEMIKDIPENIRSGVTVVDGHQVDQIYRVEVEFKASTSIIPFNVFTLRDEFFAGAYPFCASVLPNVPHRVIQKMPDFKPRAKLEAMLANCKLAYGSMIFTAMHVYGGDAEKVLRMIMGTSHAKGLVEAGVLTVDHK